MKFLLLLILPVVLGAAPEDLCQVNQRILGGEPAEKGEFPGVVYLETKYVMEWFITLTAPCAGSLVNEHWVLTAAHCITVPASAQKRYYNVYPAKGDSEFIQSTEAMLHVEYNLEDRSNDIGIIRLPKSMFTLDRYFKTVSLPVQGQRLTSNEVTYVGWGVTSTTNSSSGSLYLKKLEHFPLDQSLCTDTIRYDESKALCSHPTIATGTACPGDSGGPIFMDGLQVGIVSKSIEVKKDDKAHIVRVETRVSAYRDWIDRRIRSHSAPLETSQ